MRAGAAGSNSIITSAASSHSGSTYLRRAITGAGGSGLYFGNTGAVTVGQSYAGSAHVRASKAVNMRMVIEWKQAGVGILSYSHGSVAPVSSAGWTCISATGTAPANAEYATITMYINGSTWAAGDTLDVDSVMFTKGSTRTPMAARRVGSGMARKMPQLHRVQP